MKSISIFLVLILSFLTACQLNNSEEVVNEHGDLENLEAFDAFVKSVENGNEDEINYVNYGIEGQRGVYTLLFNGEQINVSFSVDGEFIEEYNCKDINRDTDEETRKYVLKDCSGNYTGDFELLSVADENT